MGTADETRKALAALDHRILVFESELGPTVANTIRTSPAVRQAVRECGGFVDIDVIKRRIDKLENAPLGEQVVELLRLSSGVRAAVRDCLPVDEPEEEESYSPHVALFRHVVDALKEIAINDIVTRGKPAP